MVSDGDGCCLLLFACGAALLPAGPVHDILKAFGQAYGREQDLREAKLLWLYGAAFGCFCFLRERERGGRGFEPLPPLILLVALLVVAVVAVTCVGAGGVAG